MAFISKARSRVRQTQVTNTISGMFSKSIFQSPKIRREAAFECREKRGRAFAFRRRNRVFPVDRFADYFDVGRLIAATCEFRGERAVRHRQ
jgi:hypothetical protein